MSFLGGLFGSGVVGSIEKIALEAIQTDTEKAEASTIMLKALDPNGAMRRQISKTVSDLFKLYVMIMLVLLMFQSFQLGDIEGVEKAIANMVDLFLPITGAFSAIVTASFGVNGINSYKGK